MSDGLRVFISYAHEDESHKDKLLTQLAGLRRSGLIKTWDDRRIDPGATWETAIQSALETCDMALFLVSDAFLASDFIHSVELNRLLERREREGVIVIPLIVRPCAWEFERISALQVLPEDGKAIITHSSEDGSRDQVWADITRHLARLAETRGVPHEANPAGPAPAPVERTSDDRRRATSAQGAHDTRTPDPPAGLSTAFDSPELELSLERREAGYYQVALKFSHPDPGIDVRLLPAGSARIRMNVEDILAASSDLDERARQLGAAVFANESLSHTLNQARVIADELDEPLRVRLFLGPTVPELNGLPWEYVALPGIGNSTATGAIFARYLNTAEWRPVRLRPRAALKGLVCVPGSYGVMVAPAEPEAASAHRGAMVTLLEGCAVACGPTEGVMSINSLMQELQRGYDILYLACECQWEEGECWLEMEDGSRGSERVSGTELIRRIKELRERPRLLILHGEASMDGTPLQDRSWLNLFAARLLETGILAVVTFQSPLDAQSRADFLRCFLEVLAEDGQVDHAVAVARSAAPDDAHGCAPLLFMRLRTGRIWYTPGFSDGHASQDRWQTLLWAIEQGMCTPILGPGITDSVVASHAEIAHQWARKHHFPLANTQGEDLAHVTQYLAVNQGRMYPRRAFAQLVETEASECIDSTAMTTVPGATTSRPENPYRRLASLPFPIYVTADPSDLLSAALSEAGREPVLELCRWNADVMRHRSIYDDEPRYRPTRERPLVYQLFGNVSEPRSLVLTEDDFFNFLIGVTRNRDLIPRPVRAVLADSTLLFLGFRLDEWSFRVLFHSIMGQEGSERLSDYAHVAVQIDPEEGRVMEPERARRYLESYFQNAKISIYWGNADAFAQEIGNRWQDTR